MITRGYGEVKKESMKEGKKEGKKESKKKSSTEKDEEKIHFILDEIAKMRGYKEILVGKRKVRPIVQYADYLIEQQFGFKTIKRGEQYYDRVRQDYKTAEKNISAMDQYTDLLTYQNIEFNKAINAYYEKLAKREGFESYGDMERSKATKLGLSVGELRQSQAEDRGFASYDEYQKYIANAYVIKEKYAELIPKKDFDEISKSIKDKWTREHQKFFLFCEELWKDVIIPYYEKTKSEEAVASIQDIRNELDKFHADNPGSLSVYNIDDIAIGMSYCMEDKGIDAILSKDKKSMKFRKR